jgi:hypothetical protein
MVLLLLGFLFLLPLSAFAQSSPPIGLQGSATVLHPAPGVDYLYAQHGNSTTIYGSDPAMRWQSSQDAHRQIISQGFLFDPNPRPAPLRVPESRYRTDREIDREVCSYLVKC